MTDLLSILDGFGGRLLAWVVWMNLWTLVLLVGAILLDKLLARRVSAAWRIGLYLVVLARVALPADWSSPVGGLLPRSGGDRLATIRFDLGAVRSGGSDPESRRTSAGQTIEFGGGDWSPFRVSTPIMALIGVASLSWVWWRQSKRLAAILAVSRTARPEWSQSAPSLRLLEHAWAGPLVVGLLRPCIVLPAPAMESLGNARAWRVIRHEAAHVQRFDHVLAAVLHLLVVCAWPVVPLWIAAARIRALMEQACDEHALAGSDEAERHGYARTLIDLATGQKSPWGSATLGFGVGVAERIKALGQSRRWRAWTQACVVVPIGLALLSCSGNRGSQPTQSAVVPPASQAGIPTSNERTILVTLRLLSGVPDHPKLDWPAVTPGLGLDHGNAPVGDGPAMNPDDPNRPYRLLTKSETDAVVGTERVTILTAPRLLMRPGQRGTMRIGEDIAKGMPKDGYFWAVTPTPADGKVHVLMDFDEYAPPPDAQSVHDANLEIPTGMSAAYRVSGSAGTPPRLIVVSAEVFEPGPRPGNNGGLGPTMTWPQMMLQARLDTAKAGLAYEAVLPRSTGLPPRRLSVSVDASGNHVISVTPQAKPADGWAALVPPECLKAMYAAIEQAPGFGFGADPGLLAAPREKMILETDATDKAHNPIDGRLEFTADPSSGTTTTSMQWTAPNGTGIARFESLPIPEGYTLVCFIPPKNKGEKCRIMTLTPKVIWGPSDYPFQTAGPFESMSTDDAVKNGLIPSVPK